MRQFLRASIPFLNTFAEHMADDAQDPPWQCFQRRFAELPKPIITAQDGGRAKIEACWEGDDHARSRHANQLSCALIKIRQMLKDVRANDDIKRIIRYGKVLSVALHKLCQVRNTAMLRFCHRRSNIRLRQINTRRRNSLVRKEQRYYPLTASGIQNRRSLWDERKQRIILRAMRVPP